MTGQLDDNDPGKASADTDRSNGDIPPSTLVTRSIFGGILMGLANLVPGISGGTMLLAAGIYPQFIDAVAETTRFRWRFRSLLVLTCVVGAAGLGILFFAGTLKSLVVDQMWVMYSLFIGLTLGGIPVVWRLARPVSANLVIAAAISFLGMVALAVLKAKGFVGDTSDSPLMLFLAGTAGASAMILPGLSGGYLLLLMGQYIPILSAIEDFKFALEAKDLGAALGPATSVMLPVGLGVVVGVVVVGNLLHWLLHHCRKATLGVLLGLLIGSTVGLFPFQRPVEPVVGVDSIKGRLVTEENFDSFDREDWPTEFFAASIAQGIGSMVLIGLGFGLTVGVASIGRAEVDVRGARSRGS